VLYLDSSALIKHYERERGTEALQARLRQEAAALRSVFTSVLTYAEIHGALARRTREKVLSSEDTARLHDSFDTDWVLSISPIELGTNVLGVARDLLRELPLRSADAIHLASALWLRDMARRGMKPDQYQGPLLFVCSDKRLNKAVLQKHLEVFDPETAR
jgi:predicted nucleic acid-binding protein